MIIHPYRRGSQSVAALRDYLRSRDQDVSILYRPSRFRRSSVVHWGRSGVDDNGVLGVVLNRSEAVDVFTDKLKFFRASASQYVPEWTEPDEAEAHFDACHTWLQAGIPVVERHSLTGMSGAGIRIVEPGGELQQAPLYVKYEKKTHEFRIHVAKSVDGNFFVLHHQRKVARDREAVTDWRVRNSENGFFFQQHGYNVPDAVTGAALGLIRESFPTIDFVALDVIYHEPTNRACVLEGNTAPGLEGTSVQKYGEYFIERFS